MFITLEGIEGSGKTTLVQSVVSHCRGIGRDCIATREPGGTPIGEKIRSILLNPRHSAMDPIAEMLLYMADRVQHIRQIIQPALLEGKVVVCDRYVDATIVYQGVARGLKPETVIGLHNDLLGGLWPDITLLLDLPPRQGLQRAWRQIDDGERGSEESRFEKEAMDFHSKIREGYLARAMAEPNRFRVVNAALPQQEVEAEVVRMVSEALPPDP